VPSSTVEVLALARQLVSRKTGVIRRLAELPRWPDEPALSVMSSSVASFGALPGGSTIAGGGSAHPDRAGAAVRAMMETTERYCAAIVDPSALREAPPGPAPDFVAGRELPLFTPQQYQSHDFPYRPLTATTPITWCTGRSLLTGAERWVPAAMVYLPFRSRNPADSIAASTSTGLACAPDREQAIATALLEVCERDAFAIAWLNRMSMPRLVPVRGSALATDIHALLAGTRASLDLVDLENDLEVPVVLAVLRRLLFGRPLVTIGLGAATTRANAARKGLYEAISEYSRVAEELLVQGASWRADPAFDHITDFRSHSLVYADPAHQPALDFLTASSVTRSIDDEPPALDPQAAITRTCATLRRAGLDAIVVDLTTRDVRSLGLHVIRVLVPEAVPLWPVHATPPLAHERLFDVPVRLGHASSRPSIGQLNLTAPFPLS
jgi:ribosomal protein S12 methylthiotransferase accessory factor